MSLFMRASSVLKAVISFLTSKNCRLVTVPVEVTLGEGVAVSTIGSPSSVISSSLPPPPIPSSPHPVNENDSTTEIKNESIRFSVNILKPGDLSAFLIINGIFLRRSGSGSKRFNGLFATQLFYCTIDFIEKNIIINIIHQFDKI